MRKLLVVVSALTLLLSIAAPTAIGAKGSGAAKPESVLTAVDGAKSKLHPKLQKQLEAGDTGTVKVFAMVRGSAAEARSYLKDSYATEGDTKLVLGSIRIQALPKLAGAKGVVSVGPIDFSQTGRPLGSKEPLYRPSNSELDTALRGLYAKEVPFSKAPALKGSNFEALKELALLDAKTHNFAEAWEAGYTGEGVTVGVLDGGTDFGHPDLIGTWQTWSGLTGSRAGWNGWAKAFDPFGALQWLAAPSQIEQGLSWYVLTDAATCKDWASKTAKAICSVKFSTRLGPSRNIAAPNAKKEHTYQFPAGVSKSGNVRLGSHPDDYLLGLFGERVAFLVTDPNTAGVYDTVYVDLDHDFKFDDEKPVTKADPVSYRDMDGDGYTDLSGGLLAFISDGATRLPGGVDAFGVSAVMAPGAITMWSGDYDPGIGGHGTLTASNIVGQGVINGKAPVFQDLPGDGKYPGAVIGGAPDAKLAPYGDIYFSFDFSTQFGYFLATHPTRGIDVTSNSYGSSDVDNDGWDAASQEADWIYAGSKTTPLFSTGNGAPGFGTESPPSPAAAITVGASTQFGGTGWDSIYDTTQITDNDVMVWSNRGFGATGSPGVDIVADGAYSAGSLTLNSFLNGQAAWETWGGTSRSTPVAAGAAALVYEAYRDEFGTIPAGFYAMAKDFIKSGAHDLGYNATIQGAGSLDAFEAVQAAIGAEASVTPNEWRAGDYRGDEYAIFSHLMSPGDTDSQEFEISDGTWDISDRQMVRTDVETMQFTSANIAQESASNFNAPDYLMDITDLVADHPDADLMVIRANYLRSEFDGNENYASDQAWRLLTYDWTDQNADGNLWTDGNDNGVVNHANLATSSNPDNFPDLNFAASEMDKGEYVRFMYHRAGSNALMSFLRDPAERYADGIFLGLQHSTKSATQPVTHFDIEIAFYENVDWSWIETPASASGSFTADIEVPEGTPYGMYEGAIVLENGDDEMVIPVAVAVAATVEQNETTGEITGSVTFGGADVAEAQEDYLYNNGSVFGANDWTWRAESGDWRFFFLDVPYEPAEGTLFLANTTWDGTAPYTDIDTLIMGPSVNHGQVLFDEIPPFGAPYIIDTVGGSPNTNIGAGVWRFDTATGGAEDFVAAPAQAGLHSVVLHQVGWQGDDFTTPFEVTLGSASVAPAAIDLDSSADAGSFELTFTSSVDLTGLTAEAFGLSQPIEFLRQTQQDDPNDPSSATVKEDITIEHASTATFTVDVGSDDVDLFIVYDANNDGIFTNSEIVASSTGGAGDDELVELVRPADGDYQLWAQGWAVAGTPDITVGIDVVQGLDMSLTGLPVGAVPAGTPVVIHVDFSKSMTVGETYFGEILLGPPTAPSALRVPVEITRTAAP